MTDPTTWATDDDADYSIDRFYTRGDKGQQTKQVRVYLPIDQIAMMEALVQGKAVPEYPTLQHVIRDALHHRLRWVDKERVQTPESALRMRMMQMKADAENMRREFAENREALESVRAALGELLQTNDRQKMQNELAKLELQAEVMPEPWRSEMWEIIHTFGGEVG